MPFEIRKTSNYGTRHPVYARLKVQTSELLHWADLSKAARQDVMEVYFGLADRLLRCHEIVEWLTTELEAAIREFCPDADSRMIDVPHISDLRGEVENFLYEGKNYLRDFLTVINIFFGANFTEASAFYSTKENQKSALVKWAKKKFGIADHFTTMLVSEQEWTGELIQKRNAVEHPGGKSGTLYIENFTITAYRDVALPHWRRDQNTPTYLFSDLTMYLENMLTLAEDILVSCIHHKLQHDVIQFVEIPPEDRRADCPVRITVQLDPSKVKPPTEPGPESLAS
jgi:hypothetical protein